MCSYFVTLRQRMYKASCHFRALQTVAPCLNYSGMFCYVAMRFSVCFGFQSGLLKLPDYQMVLPEEGRQGPARLLQFRRRGRNLVSLSRFTPHHPGKATKGAPSPPPGIHYTSHNESAWLPDAPSLSSSRATIGPHWSLRVLAHGGPCGTLRWEEVSHLIMLSETHSGSPTSLTQPLYSPANPLWINYPCWRARRSLIFPFHPITMPGSLARGRSVTPLPLCMLLPPLCCSLPAPSLAAVE